MPEEEIRVSRLCCTECDTILDETTKHLFKAIFQAVGRVYLYRGEPDSDYTSEEFEKIYCGNCGATFRQFDDCEVIYNADGSVKEIFY